MIWNQESGAIKKADGNWIEPCERAGITRKAGLASVTVPVTSGAQKRLGAFSAGMALGEMGFLDRAPRSAVITAETDVECDILKLDEFEPLLAQTHPSIKMVLFTNMSLGIADRLRKATQVAIPLLR